MPNSLLTPHSSWVPCACSGACLASFAGKVFLLSWPVLGALLSLSDLKFDTHRVSYSVGALYLYAGDSIRKNTAGGIETALGAYLLNPYSGIRVNSAPPGASAILFLSSAPRSLKGPVPAILTLTSAVAGGYYGNVFYSLRQH
jgi:hypothetical protein